MWRVVIADDHVLLRTGLVRLLEPYFEIAAQTGDGPSTVRAVDDHRPDALLLDLNMPGSNPPELIRELLLRHRTLRIITFTGSMTQQQIRTALAAGAVGIFLKTSDSSLLRSAIEKCLEGGMFLDPDLRLDAGDDPSDDLTPREREIMVRLARGASYRDVGREMRLGERTIETYRRRIGEKLGLKSRAELVAYALRTGILTTGT